MNYANRDRVWAEIDLDALLHNYRRACELNRGKWVLPVVKADAYGHGALQVAGALAEAGAWGLGVASCSEALYLRRHGIRVPVIVLGAVPPELVRELAAQEVTLCLPDLATAAAYREALGDARVRVHIKVETGMNRLGLCPGESVEAILEMASWPCFEAEGVFTHFAASGEGEKDGLTAAQQALFDEIIRRLRERGFHPALLHCANTDALLRHPATHADMVRPGLFLYGYAAEPAGLRPVLSLRARVAQVKWVEAGETVSYSCTWTAPVRSQIAVVSAGYADGLHRVASDGIYMLVRGQKAPQVGRICMDMCMLDVTEIDGVQTGDVATIIGADGALALTAETWAAAAGTVPYEILTSVGMRVPRYYYREGRQVHRLDYFSLL